MGVFKRWMTRLSTSTVRRTLATASPEKLVTHYNKAQQATRLTDDPREIAELANLQRDINAELMRRGIKTSGG